MDAVDETIPLPTRALDKPFALSVEDVFSIQGRGTVVTGRIEQGIIRTGDEVQIIGISPTPIKSVVTGVLSGTSGRDANLKDCDGQAVNCCVIQLCASWPSHSLFNMGRAFVSPHIQCNMPVWCMNLHAIRRHAILVCEDSFSHMVMAGQ